MSDHPKPFLSPWTWHWLKGWVRPTKRIAYLKTEFGGLFKVVDEKDYEETMCILEAELGELREYNEEVVSNG